MSNIQAENTGNTPTKQLNRTPAKLFFSMPSPQEMQQLIEFCKVMASAPFYQKLGPGGIMAIYLTAKERDLPFMSCLNGGVHTFDGKITFSAILINTMIINAGHTADIIHSDEQSCKIVFTRGDRKNDPKYKPLVWDYTIKQAEKAGYLKKLNWQTSPKDMLWSRCLTGGGRKHIPEVFIGVLAAGELVDDDSDQYVEINAPIEAMQAMSTLEETLPTPKTIEHEKLEGYEEFCQKHLREDDKMAYVRKIAQATNKTEAQIINSAVSNESGFLTAFNKWKTDQQNVEKRAKSKANAQEATAMSLPIEGLVATA
ncbi:MAG: hypothetical protein ACRDF4_12335 [Rhabdochlamydiaceae bacterium]